MRLRDEGIITTKQTSTPTDPEQLIAVPVTNSNGATEIVVQNKDSAVTYDDAKATYASRYGVVAAENASTGELAQTTGKNIGVQITKADTEELNDMKTLSSGSSIKKVNYLDSGDVAFRAENGNDTNTLIESSSQTNNQLTSLDRLKLGILSADQKPKPEVNPAYADQIKSENKISLAGTSQNQEAYLVNNPYTGGKSIVDSTGHIITGYTNVEAKYSPNDGLNRFVIPTGTTVGGKDVTAQTTKNDTLLPSIGIQSSQDTGIRVTDYTSNKEENNKDLFYFNPSGVKSPSVADFAESLFKGSEIIGSKVTDFGYGIANNPTAQEIVGTGPSSLLFSQDTRKNVGKSVIEGTSELAGSTIAFPGMSTAAVIGMTDLLVTDNKKFVEAMSYGATTGLKDQVQGVITGFEERPIQTGIVMGGSLLLAKGASKAISKTPVRETGSIKSNGIQSKPVETVKPGGISDMSIPEIDLSKATSITIENTGVEPVISKSTAGGRARSKAYVEGVAVEDAKKISNVFENDEYYKSSSFADNIREITGDARISSDPWMSVSDKSNTYQSYTGIKIEPVEQPISKKTLFDIDSLSSKRGGLYADDTAYMGLRQEIKPRTRKTQRLKLEQIQREATNSNIKTKMREFQISDSILVGLTSVNTASTINKYASKNKTNPIITEIVDNRVKPIPGLTSSYKYDTGVFSVTRPTNKQKSITNTVTSNALMFGAVAGTTVFGKTVSNKLGTVKGLGRDYSGAFNNNKNRSMKNTRNPVGDLTKLIGMTPTKKVNNKKKNKFRGLL